MEKTEKVFSFRVIAPAFFFIVIMPSLPILISRQWNWWEGWAYVILGVVSFVISRYLAAKQNPDIISERTKLMRQEDAQPWDKRIIPLVGVIGIISVIVVGLDRLFSWTPIFDLWIRLLGLLLLTLGYILSSYALVVNRFFSGMVRLQTDRGQHVISEGPYRWVRHPGYAGGLLSYLATPLLLNSFWAAIPILIAIGLYFLRTSLEDRFLQENLEGYHAYAEKVRYRLIPAIW